MVSGHVSRSTAVRRWHSFIQFLMRVLTFIQLFGVQLFSAQKEEKMTKTASDQKQLSAIPMEPAIWNGRWQALDQNITDTISPLRSKESKEAWEITLESTLTCLQAFGKKQFCFFLEGFQNGRLVDSPQLKAEFAIRQTLDQISFDLAVLRIVQSQRHPDLSTERERQTLQLADQLAYRALKPTIDAELIHPTTVLTYFKKTSQVRVIPYAPVALLGIPYTCTGIFDEAGARVQNSDDSTHTARDFLAIAHEVGHHVFWHGKQGNIPLRSLLRSRLAANPAWRMAWLEEIFADVYGTLIAGPVLALDFQELIYDNPNLDEDDGEHPVGAIRPFIYTDTLSKIKDKRGKPKYANSPTKLEQKWKNSRARRGKIKRFRPQKAAQNEPVLLEDARAHLDEVITLILDILQSIEAEQYDTAWSADSISPDASLYQTFRDEILKKLRDTAPTFQVQPQGIGLETVTAGENNTITWEEGKSLAKWFSLFVDAPTTYGLTLLPETWRTLLEGGGWAAGGPDTEGEPKGP